jgi:hypothetical protein
MIPPVGVKTVPGLVWHGFDGSFPWVPEFSGETAVSHGVSAGLDAGALAGKGGGLFTCYLVVPADGTYTLTLATEGRAFVRLHEAALLDADFGYMTGGERSASVHLRAGSHPLRVAYVPGGNGPRWLHLDWSGPGIPRRPVPASAFAREAQSGL